MQIKELLFYAIVLLISFVISYVFFLRQQNAMLSFHGGADAESYIAISQDMLHGLLNGLRTYGYPAFLKLIRYFYPISQIFTFYTFVIQYTLYALSVIFFTFSVTTSKNIRRLISAALLLQINVLTFLPVTLTDSLSLDLLLINCGIFFCMRKNGTRAFLLGLCAAFSMEVRPANLWVYCFILSIFLLEFSHYKNNKIVFLKQMVLFFIGSLISFAPQIYFNWVHFHTFTPFSAVGLGSFQFKTGKNMAYYSASLTNKALFFIVKNPFLLTSPYEFSYFSLNGLSYALLKVMLMFNHILLFVFQDLSQTHQKMMMLFSSFNTYFGILGLSLQYKKISYEKVRAIFIGLGFCILLHLTTALEDRFTFAICLLLFPFAIYQFWQFIKEKQYRYLSFFILFFLFVNLFNTFIQTLAPDYVSAIKTGLLK